MPSGNRGRRTAGGVLPRPAARPLTGTAAFTAARRSAHASAFPPQRCCRRRGAVKPAPLPRRNGSRRPPSCRRRSSRSFLPGARGHATRARPLRPLSGGRESNGSGGARAFLLAYFPPRPWQSRSRSLRACALRLPPNSLPPTPAVQTGRRTCWCLSQVSSQSPRPDLRLSPLLKPPSFPPPCHAATSGSVLKLARAAVPLREAAERGVYVCVVRGARSRRWQRREAARSRRWPPSEEEEERKKDAVAVAPPLKCLLPCPRGAARSGGRGGLCAQLAALRSPPAPGRAQPRRGAASPPGPPRAPSLRAHGRTNPTALRQAAERIFLRFFFPPFLSVLPCWCPRRLFFFLFFLNFFYFPLLLFLLVFRKESCPSEPGTDRRAAAPAGRGGGGTATLAPRAASPAGKMRLLRRWGPSRGGRERKPAAAEL